MSNKYQIGDKVYIYRKTKSSFSAKLIKCEIIKFYLNKMNKLIYSLKSTEGKSYREEELGILLISKKDEFIEFLKS